MAFDLESLKNYLNEHDRFCNCNNMKLTVIREGYAEAELEVILEKHMNGLNVVQGGAIFTLCDLAFAGAINSYGVKAIGMSGATSYLKPATGTLIKAVATEISRGRQTAVYNVDAFNSAGKLLTRCTFTGFLLNDKFDFPEK